MRLAIRSSTDIEPMIDFVRSHTDVPVMRSLELYREEAHPAGRQERAVGLSC